MPQRIYTQRTFLCLCTAQDQASTRCNVLTSWQQPCYCCHRVPAEDHPAANNSWGSSTRSGCSAARPSPAFVVVQVGCTNQKQPHCTHIVVAKDFFLTNTQHASQGACGSLEFCLELDVCDATKPLPPSSHFCCTCLPQLVLPARAWDIAQSCSTPPAFDTQPSHHHGSVKAFLQATKVCLHTSPGHLDSSHFCVLLALAVLPQVEPRRLPSNCRSTGSSARLLTHKATAGLTSGASSLPDVNTTHLTPCQFLV